MKKSVIIVSIGLLAALQCAGCGSGGSGGSGSDAPAPLPQEKTAKIVFSASTSAALPVPVRTLKMVANIPAGVSVPLDANGTPVFSTPKTGAFKGGSYIPPRLTITLADATSPSGLGAVNVGTFAEIVISYPAGLTLTEASFTGINNPFPEFAAGGVSGTPPTQTTEDLASFLKPSMKVTF